LDADYVGYRQLVDWLCSFPPQEVARRQRYLRDRKATLGYRLGLFTGGMERLGVLPVLVVLYLQFKDWGFGDWESALGAASHMGNRPIAEYLLSKGARPSIFSAAMFGQLEVVKAFITAQPGLQRTRGPHSISLLAHAKAGGPAASAVYDYLATLGDAGSDSPTPLTQTDLDAIVGIYPFGPAENDRINVAAEKGSVTWTRTASMGRPLFHHGNRVFNPAGAEAVRIAFTVEPTGTRMTIHDPDVVLTVMRKS